MSKHCLELTDDDINRCCDILEGTIDTALSYDDGDLDVEACLTTMGKLDPERALALRVAIDEANPGEWGEDWGSIGPPT